MILKRMKSQENSIENGDSTLRARSILGFFLMVMAAKDLLAWAEFTSVESGWLVRVTGAEWLEPFGSLAMAVLGMIWAGPSLTQCFGVRDEFRKWARRWALCSAIICGAALVYTVDTTLASKEVFLQPRASHLTREARQNGLVGVMMVIAGFAGFVLMRRRDVGFWKVSLPVRRDNDIWSMSMKAEVALRAIGKNDEAYHLLEGRAEYIQSEIGGKFDVLCRHLARESADLATIDSTARLQMDVGHIFKRYADFHVRLAETRHRIADEIRQAASDTLVEMLEHKLPGQKLKAGTDASLAIAYPVLHDAEGLQRRREEWDETMRGVVSIGAAKGNEIIGEWIDRATRGEITAEEMPVAMDLLRSLCAPPASSGRPLEIAAQSGPTQPGFAGTAQELHAWIGKDASIETPGVASRIRAFFAEKKLMLENCSNPEISAETLMDMVRSEYGGILTLQSIAAVLGRRRS